MRQQCYDEQLSLAHLNESSLVRTEYKFVVISVRRSLYETDSVLVLTDERNSNINKQIKIDKIFMI